MIRWSTTIVVLLLAAVAAVVSYRHAYEVIVANGESGWVAYLVPLTIDGLIFASSMVLLDAARRGLKVPKLARFTLALGILATLAANVAHGWVHGPVGAIVAAWPAIGLVLSYELLMGLIRRSAVSSDVKADITRQVEAVEEVSSPAVEVHVPAVPEPVSAVLATVGVSPTVEPEGVTGDTVERVEVTPLAVCTDVHIPAVPDPFAGVPPQVNGSTLVSDLTRAAGASNDAPDEQVQPAPAHDPDAPYYPLALNHFLSDVVSGEQPTVRTIKDQMSVGTDRARRLQAYLGGLVEVAR